MLLNLHVKNLALIEESEIDFAPNLNILTGETGAGKSILIGSIQSALGSKIPRDMIRVGADSALIELVFHTESETLRQKFQELEIPFEDGDIIISRRITNQRVINKVNDTSVTVSKLKEISPLLLDLSGQHENQRLISPKNHQEIVDNYGKEKIVPVREKVRELFLDYQRLQKQLREESSDSSERNRELEFLQYETKEIKDARLKIGEDEELESQYQRIVHSKDILESCASTYALTSDGNNGAAYLIGKALREFGDVSSLDEQASGLSEQLENLENLLNDFNRELSDYMEEMEFDEETFREIEERLDLINHLKAKYGDSIEEILAYQKKNEDRYEKLLHFEEYIASLQNKAQNAKRELEKKADELTKLRKAAAKPLEKEIKKALLDLNFNDVKFEISITPKIQCQADGIDDVCFMLSTNPGLPMGPLHEIASGGELSRIMLAIKSILADEDQIETLIFDEIDTGISGRTAQKVSERLSLMGKNRQVIAITHLPQIAAMADAHYLIEKTSSATSTISSITRLSDEESVEELARMLGGAEITDIVLDNAREMKKLAQSKKKL